MIGIAVVLVNAGRKCVIIRDCYLLYACYYEKCMIYPNSTTYKTLLILISLCLLGIVVHGVSAQGVADRDFDEAVFACSSQDFYEECYRDLCADIPDGAVCVESLLRSIALRDAGFAMTTLTQLLQSDFFDLWQSEYHLAQTVGRIAFESADSTRLGDFFLSCTPEFSRGCYYGFFEALTSSGGTPPTALTVCDGVPDASRVSCYRLMGQMVMKQSDYVLAAALNTCTTWESSVREYCYDGVFFEHSSAFFDFGVAQQLAFLESDPLAPCNRVSEDYQGACYKHHGRYLLSFFGDGSFDPLRICRGAGEYKDVCEQSVSDARVAAVDSVQHYFSQPAADNSQPYTPPSRSWWQQIIDSIVGLFFGLFGG